MANRQRSFFDQNSNNCPLRWKTWKSNDAGQRTEPPAKVATSMAPITASSQSRSKLKAFQYEQKMEPVHIYNEEVEKENKKPRAGEKKPHVDPPSQHLSQKSVTKDTQDCPQTPLGRLPLSELIASGEDNRQYLNPAPIERVLWDHSPLNSHLTNSTSNRNGRKRAHSSSPASSSQNEALVHFTKEKKAPDIQALQKALTTPRADPAHDLWARYSSNMGVVNRISPTSPTGSQFANLMHSSSPQTPLSRVQKDSGGLRRALSCVEWPASAAKRRKMFHGSSQRDSAADPSTTDRQNAEQSKRSRVNLLVEQLHMDLAKPIAPQHSDSSSVPGRSSPVSQKDDSPSSPVEATDTVLPSQEKEEIIADVVNILSQTAVAPLTCASKPFVLSDEDIKDLGEACSSDFDDEDLDMEIMESINHNDQLPLESSKGTSREDQAPAASCHDRVSGAKNQAQDSTGQRSGDTETDAKEERFVQELPAKAKEPSSDIDEFDEDDRDMFAADLEDICAKYESQARPDESQKQNLETDANTSKRPSTLRSAPSEILMPPEIEVISDDDFGDDSDFEQIAAEYAEETQKQQVSQPQSSFDRKRPVIQRFVIRSVTQSTYEDSDGRTYSEKILSVQCERTKLNKIIALRQAWIESPCAPESFLHLIGDFDRYGQCIVDNAQNLLILHPDHLISSTVVGDSFTCTRKAVLQDRVKATSDANQATLYGHMLHEIFQEAMRVNQWDDEFIIRTIENLAALYLEMLYEIDVELPVAVEHLKTRVTDLQAWAEIFISGRPRSDAVVKDRNGTHSLMSINKLLEVEEKVWSPMYGLKGNVDATVQVLLQDGSHEMTLTVPFELKTGKHQSAAHKAQTSLYTLLLSDRYDVDIACGILYYMQSSEIFSVRSLRHEMMPMIMQRNELASYVRHRVELPPMVKRPHICGKCYAKTPCFIYHKMIDDGNGETSGMGEKFDDVVKHLNPNHQEFFRKWDDLLTKEEKDVIRFRRELWTMHSTERQKVGRCWGNLVIDAGSFRKMEGASKINRFQYTFVKQQPSPGFVFTESQITLGEPIVVSDEKGHYALANGYVTSIRKNRVEISIDRRLHNARVKSQNFDLERNQSFVGIMQVVEDGNSQSTTPLQPEEPVIYRIDKDEFSNGMAMIRNNLIRLMEKDVFGVQALRRLIVENVPPTFKPNLPAYSNVNTAIQADLNVDQKAAIEKVMSAKDYALVLGMPGTGKTTTIAHIIRALVAQGKKVLLTSYTHTAVDNILLKLRDDELGIFRLGAVAKVHPEVQEFADLAGTPAKTIEDLERCYAQPVVATTCLGINHPIFNQRIFDYCIVDEASQITLPVCLGPIRMARTFILVGDHYQLPPLVQNKEASDGGLDVSLFKMLSDNHAESVVNLEHQYRMCEDIMTLSNTLIYSGRLKCGTQAVADSSIIIPHIGGLGLHHHNSQSARHVDPHKVCANSTRGSCWLRDLLDPSVKACFVNTDALIPRSRETLENGSRITNPTEVTLATQLVESLLTVGLKSTDIGVITPYRSQLALLKQCLRHRSGVEMHTADKFQGRDKEVVILSMVRSNEAEVVGELLKDWRRVNVALTRARTKLLILGSRGTLVGNDLLKDMISLMERKGWIYHLPATACEGHVWEDMATQMSGRGSAEFPGVKDQKSPLRNTKMKVLGVGHGKENGRRMPAKQGKLDMNALLGRRPVLKDIVNDAS